MSLCLFVVLAFGSLEETPEEKAAREARAAKWEAERAEADARKKEQEAKAQERLDNLPASQKAFCKALNEHRDAYNDAPNDLKKSKTRKDRAEALKAAVPGGRVTKWEGTVSELTTTGDGNVVLKVQPLGCEDFTVGTWNNEFSDIMDKTLISKNSSIFDVLAEMSVGQGLTFSGRLVPDSEGNDGWGETSMTEYGSMTGGAFLMRF